MVRKSLVIVDLFVDHDKISPMLFMDYFIEADYGGRKKSRIKYNLNWENFQFCKQQKCFNMEYLYIRIGLHTLVTQKKCNIYAAFVNFICFGIYES